MKVLLILLAILKIAGIILLSLLAIVILLLLIILFVPIRYEAKFELKEQWWIIAKASWLLKLFSFTFEYKEKQSTVTIRAIKKLKDRSEEDDENTESNLKESKVELQSQGTPDSEETEPDETLRPEQEEVVKIPDKSQEEVNEKTPNVQSQPISEDKIDHKVKAKSKQKKKKKPEKSEKTKEESMVDKLKKVYNHPLREVVWKKFKHKLIGLWRHVRPRKYHIDLIIGFEDPSQTGYIMAFYGMMKGFIDSKNHFVLEGDFTQPRLEGEGYLKGRIYLFYILYIAVALIIDKKVRNYASFIMKTFK